MLFFCSIYRSYYCLFFVLLFFNDTSTTEIYTLSLHDALPIYVPIIGQSFCQRIRFLRTGNIDNNRAVFRFYDISKLTVFFLDRKSTRLNSSHLVISYAVFCLKKKKKESRNFT